ncbi:sulfite exporter TauE/SafE family protein [Melioribacter sp. OK-6-Me]|uniref:sulfite exporter TauE/SafE family protein n=1 Tax=unclassified Melioribacter TaxID=2627329 RepID=UPI003EDA7D35
MNVILLTLIILLISVFMTMTGHGGGNFFVITLILSGTETHIAASTGQFILFTAAFFAMLVFGKKKFVEWKLVVFVGVLIGVSAFIGGFFSDYVDGRILKLILSAFLFLIAVLMLVPINKEVDQVLKTGWMYWNIKSFDESVIYPLNLILIVPAIFIFGLVAGMVGISGGSFIVPLLVLSCNVPMKNAVATASTLISISALTGFLGHAVKGHFDYRLAIPLAIGGVIGGVLGGSIALKTKPKMLKTLFAFTTFIAAVIMAHNVF